jgi:predicted nucleic acid-binding protein
MVTDSPVRVVIDTNVVFEGLTKQGGAEGFIIDAWVVRQFDVGLIE